MILLLAAVPLETTIIRAQLADKLQLITRKNPAPQPNQADTKLFLAHTGIGQINMAMQLSRILTIYSPDAAILFGCGGAYPNSGLQLGDTVIASSETLGDTGIATTSGFIPFEQLNIAEDHQLAPQFKQCYQLNSTLRERAAVILSDTPQGPFVTVSTCSGHPLLSEELDNRVSGLCENMEGAAAARVCEEFNIPLLEIRGISNPTGTRDPQQWNIPKGTAAAQYAVIKLLENWS